MTRRELSHADERGSAVGRPGGCPSHPAWKVGHWGLYGAISQWLLLLALAVAALVACHDSPRHNPVDPDLTPAVDLQATLDDSTGHVALSWSVYYGDETFYRYWVLRRASGQTRVDTLAVVADIVLTDLEDTTVTPSTAYLYRVSVVTRGGFEQPSAEQAVSGYLVGAVQLQPLLIEATTGSVALTWTRFANPGFESYEVRRREVGTDQTQILARMADVADTSLVDTSGRHRMTYAYEVHTRAGGENLASNSVEGQVVLPAVALEEAVFSSADATASLSWTAYDGPAFARYEVRRRTSQLAPQTIYTTSELAATRFEDGNLRGNTEYLYEVVVVTARGEEVAGTELGGGFHRLVATWDLPWDGLVYIRLLCTSSGAVVALTEDGESEGIRRVTLGPEGVLAETSGRLLEELKVDRYYPVSGYNLTAGPDPLRPQLMLLGHRFGTVLVGFDGADGALLHSRTLTLEWPSDQVEYGAFSEALTLRGPPWYRHLRVTSAGQLVRVEDFTTWPELVDRDATWSGLGAVGEDLLAAGWYWEPASIVRHHTGSEWLILGNSRVTWGDSTWGELSLDVHALGHESGGDRPEIGIGGDIGARARFAVDYPDRVHLVWEFSPPPGSELGALSLETETRYPSILSVPPHLSLSNEGGRLEGTVTSAVDPQLEEQDPWSLVSILGLDEVTSLIINNRTYFVESDGTLQAGPALANRATEVRTWAGRRSPEVGVCLPEENMIVTGQVPDGLGRQWPELLDKTIGPAIGASPPDFFATPISFDVGPDRRFYILDAGNARIASFTSTRRFVTEWGEWGDGEGQFNFGGGAGGDAGIGFKGSLAVDADGYIYVADEINKRIQVFSP